jgi:hypothetical protein
MYTGKPWLKFERQTNYAGLRPRDIVIWEEFILKFPLAFDTVCYDVVIGDPTRPGDDEAAMKAGGAYQVMQWRVDVIGKHGDTYTIIEVKPDALAGSLGQVLAYKALLVDEKRIPANATCVVLTDSLSPITERAAKLMGVTVFVP